MGARLAEDVKSVSEFKKQIREVFTRLHRTGRPVVITVNGRRDVVLLDAAVFERKLRALNLQALLAEGEADVAAGRTRSARTAVKALRCRSKRELVHLALTEPLKSARRRDLLSLRGLVKWEGDLAELRRLRSTR